MAKVRAIGFGNSVADLHGFLDEAVADGADGGILLSFRKIEDGWEWKYLGAGEFSSHTGVFALEQCKLEILGVEFKK